MEKTPLACFHELCSRRKLIPQYVLLNEIPGKKYEYRLNVDGNDVKFTDIFVRANGRSKKEAKHLAAYEALVLIKEKSIRNTNSNSKNDVDDYELNDIEKTISLYDNKIKENNVYKLKEICLSNLLPTPQYLFVNNNDENGKKVHYLKCVVAGLIENGCSFSKNDARQISAGFMIDRIRNILQSNFVYPEKLLYNDDEDDEGNKGQIDKKIIETYNLMLKKYKENTIRNNYKIKTNDYHNVMYEEEFLYMNYIIKTTLNNYDELSIKKLLNPIVIWDDICNKCHTNYNFYKYKTISKYNNCNNMVYYGLHIETSPPWVVIGKGDNDTNAKNNCVINMLVFLKELLI